MARSKLFPTPADGFFICTKKDCPVAAVYVI